MHKAFQLRVDCHMHRIDTVHESWELSNLNPILAIRRQSTARFEENQADHQCDSQQSTEGHSELDRIRWGMAAYQLTYAPPNEHGRYSRFTRPGPEHHAVDHQ
jgi:hypothetical protein